MAASPAALALVAGAPSLGKTGEAALAVAGTRTRCIADPHANRRHEAAVPQSARNQTCTARPGGALLGRKPGGPIAGLVRGGSTAKGRHGHQASRCESARAC